MKLYHSINFTSKRKNIVNISMFYIANIIIFHDIACLFYSYIFCEYPSFFVSSVCYPGAQATPDRKTQASFGRKTSVF